MNKGRPFLAAAGFSLAALAVVSCSGGGGGGDREISRRITVSGDFSAGTHAKWVVRLLDWIIPSAAALDPNEISQVVVFDSEGDYDVATVTNGAFSVSVDTGAPVAIIFAGAADNFLGYLTLGNGIDSLPLTTVAPGVSTIDLQSLSSNGQIVVPAHNPIGSEVILSTEEQTATARIDDFLATVAKNADLDGDTRVDVLTGEHYYPQILYFISAGSFGGDLVGDPVVPAAIGSHKLALHAVGTGRPATVTFTGPAGYALSGSVSEQKNVYTESTTYFSVQVNSAVPPAGTYTVGYGGKTLTYALADQSGAPNSVVLPVPTVTLSGGVVQQVSWEYKLGDGSAAALDPTAMISRVELQIEGSGTPCATYPQPGRVYNSGSLPVATTSHTLTCHSVQWTDVTQLHMAYNDVYGNHYVVTWTP